MASPVDFSSYTSSLKLVQAQDLKCKKILGEGGFGIVYLAHHHNYDDVAVKYFKKILQKSIKYFEREVLRMLKTASPQLVEMYGPIETSPTFKFCCIVMEYMEFGSLSSFRQRLKTFPDSVKIHMVYGIALGMNFLHTLKEPIIHQDLKLDNVFVSKSLEAKVGDFGLATWNNATNCRESAGTLTHIPPEKLDKIDTDATAKHDVYSFGITLWELATGQQVFENCQSCLMSHGVQNGQRPDETKIAGNEPLIIKTLMKEAWDQDPAKRPEFKEIKDRIKEEFDLNYKQFWDDDCKDVKDQLCSEVSVHKDQLHEETAIFPWENNTVSDSTNTGTPAPLQSADGRPGTEVEGYHVAASDDGAQANILGHSILMNQVTTQKPSQDYDLGNFSDMTITSNAVQATPDNQASDAELHESELRPPRLRPLQNQGVSSSANALHVHPSVSGQRKSKKTPPLPPSSSDSLDSDATQARTADSITSLIVHATSREPVTEKIIWDISQYIGKTFRSLGRALDLSDVEIDNIEEDNCRYGQREIAHKVMLAWQKSHRKSEATKANLAKALEKADLTEIAEML